MYSNAQFVVVACSQMFHESLRKLTETDRSLRSAVENSWRKLSLRSVAGRLSRPSFEAIPAVQRATTRMVRDDCGPVIGQAVMTASDAGAESVVGRSYLRTRSADAGDRMKKPSKAGGQRSAQAIFFVNKQINAFTDTGVTRRRRPLRQLAPILRTIKERADAHDSMTERLMPTRFPATVSTMAREPHDQAKCWQHTWLGTPAESGKKSSQS